MGIIMEQLNIGKYIYSMYLCLHKEEATKKEQKLVYDRAHRVTADIQIPYHEQIILHSANQEFSVS